jgi:hypothetical protein
VTPFVFQLPGSRCLVMGETEAEARATLARHSYPGAPVTSWPRLLMLPDALWAFQYFLEHPWLYKIVRKHGR